MAVQECLLFVGMYRYGLECMHMKGQILNFNIADLSQFNDTKQSLRDTETFISLEVVLQLPSAPDI